MIIIVGQLNKSKIRTGREGVQSGVSRVEVGTLFGFGMGRGKEGRGEKEKVGGRGEKGRREGGKEYLFGEIVDFVAGVVVVRFFGPEGVVQNVVVKLIDLGVLVDVVLELS